MTAPAMPVPLTSAAGADRSRTGTTSAMEQVVWDDPSRRQRAEAVELGRVLLRRIGAEGFIVALETDERFKRAIALWGIEFPLNIRWYTTAIPAQERALRWSRRISLALGVVTLAGTTALVFLNQAVTTAQVGVLAAGIFGVMQILAAGSDPKSRLGGFRKARADLKEAMFTFQENWRGRSIILAGSEAKPEPEPEFMTALYQEIRSGRKIAREERDTYFATFKSATEILGVANTAIEAVRGRRAEVSGALKEASAAETTHAAAMAARIQDLRNKLADAIALKDALQDKKRRLEEANADPKVIGEVQTKIDDAETDRFRTQRSLDLAVKSDVAHSI